VLFVGANYQRKGLPDLLRAAALIKRKRPGIVVHIFGADPKERVARRLADDLGLGNSTVISRTGAKRTHSPTQGRHVRDAVVVEGFGIVFLEAMANGTPVVGGAVGWHRRN